MPWPHTLAFEDDGTAWGRTYDSLTGGYRNPLAADFQVHHSIGYPKEGLARRETYPSARKRASSRLLRSFAKLLPAQLKLIQTLIESLLGQELAMAAPLADLSMM